MSADRPKRPRLCLRGALAGALALALALACAGALAQAAPAPETLLFTSNRDGGPFELYLLNAEGGGPRRLLPRREVANVSWSPDGRAAVFASTHNGNSDIYTINLDSGQVQRLTDHPAFDGEPVWSPDGQSIAFQSYRNSTPKLYLMRADGGGQRRLTEGKDEESNAVYAPDNRKLAYVIKPGRKLSRIRQVDLATGESAPLGSEEQDTSEYGPVWSPDGRRLAYQVQKGDTSHIHTMRADGSEKVALTKGDSRNNEPRWSPDGTRLLYLSIRKPSPRQLVYVSAADGQGERLLTPGGDEHLLARWAPDGKRIYFVRFQARGGQIFSIDASGANQARLSDGLAYDYEIAVGPQGRTKQKMAAR